MIYYLIWYNQRFTVRQFLASEVYISGKLGSGGLRSILIFFIVSDKGKCQLPGTFFGMNNFPNQTYRIVKSRFLIWASEVKISNFESCVFIILKIRY